MKEMKKNFASCFLLLMALLMSGCVPLSPPEKQAQALVGHPISEAYAQFGKETEEHPERALSLKAVHGFQPLTTHVWSGPYDGTHQDFIQTGSSQYMANGGLVNEIDGYYQTRQNWLIIVLYTNVENIIVDWNSFNNGRASRRSISPND
jgi:hypothetical protein